MTMAIEAKSHLRRSQVNSREARRSYIIPILLYMLVSFRVTRVEKRIAKYHENMTRNNFVIFW
jgi:hypothetical protein